MSNKVKGLSIKKKKKIMNTTFLMILSILKNADPIKYQNR